jgi:proteasome lid subunit RPN8/RPN11
MSDVPDPQDAFESTDFEPSLPGDKRIIFGARKPTEEASPLTGIPLLIEAPFPHERTFHWLPAALDLDLNSDRHTAVVVTQEVLVKVNVHVSQSLDRELGGFLLGNRYRCPNTNCDYVVIDQYSPAKYTESSEIRLNFTHDTWAQLSDELSGKFLGKLLIGWYHSHPRMDVFLSSHDMEIQTERFSEPWMVALVLEPEKHLGGFFCSRDGRVNPNSPVDFFELLERNSRDSVIGWENYNALNPEINSTPVLSPTNTASPAQTSSPELPVVVAEECENNPVTKKRSGRLIFVAAVVVLMGILALGVTNRNRIRAWLQNRSAVPANTSVQPTPTATLDQSQQQMPTPQKATSTPQVSPSVSPTPEASPPPTKSSPAMANANQAAAEAEQPSEVAQKGATKPAKESRRRKHKQ